MGCLPPTLLPPSLPRPLLGMLRQGKTQAGLLLCPVPSVTRYLPSDCHLELPKDGRRGSGPAAGQGEDCIGRRPAEFGRTVTVVFGGEGRTRGVLKAPCPRGPPARHGNLDGGAKRVSRRNRGPEAVGGAAWCRIFPQAGASRSEPRLADT